MKIEFFVFFAPADFTDLRRFFFIDLIKNKHLYLLSLHLWSISKNS